MSKVSKGNYNRNKTKTWLEGLGYTVASLENKRSIFIPEKDGKPARTIFQTSDIWGSDLCAKNAEEMIFIQVKSNRGHLATGEKEIESTVWPSFIKRWVVIWPERGRIKDGPEIREMNKNS